MSEQKKQTIGVIIGEFQGVINDVFTFKNWEDAEKKALELEKDYDIPPRSDKQAYEEYFDNPECNRVHRYGVELK